MKKIRALFLSALFAAVAMFPLVGCTKEDPAKTLYIDISNAGYGIAWLDPLVDIFEAEHEGVTVKVRSAVKNDGDYVNKFLSGAADTDLYFVETDVLGKVNTPVNSGGTRYEIPFADLTTCTTEKFPGKINRSQRKCVPSIMRSIRSTGIITHSRG